LCFAVTRLLQARDIPVLCACHERKVDEFQNEEGGTEKKALFGFIRFRAYNPL